MLRVSIEEMKNWAKGHKSVVNSGYDKNIIQSLCMELGLIFVPFFPSWDRRKKQKIRNCLFVTETAEKFMNVFLLTMNLFS